MIEAPGEERKGSLPSEGTTSTKTQRTEERWHNPELEEGHKMQRARMVLEEAGWRRRRHRRWVEARWYGMAGDGSGDGRGSWVFLCKSLHCFHVEKGLT